MVKIQTTILVAAADAALSMRICGALRERGYNVCTAQNSDAIRTQIRTVSVDLLVLGHALPGDNWLLTLQWLRNDPRTSVLPVIVLTGGMEEADVYQGWQAGVDGFQSTRQSALPALTQELLAKIRRIFRSIEEDSLAQPDLS